MHFESVPLTVARSSVGAMLIVLATATTAIAQKEPAGATSTAAPTEPAIGNKKAPSDEDVPSCLDQSIVDELGERVRPRGVQKRVFLKQGELQLTARGGIFAGDLLSSSYIAGGSLVFFATEDLGVELSFDVMPVELDLDVPLATFFGDDRFEKGLGYLARAGLLWSPIHAKARIGGGIVHADILFAAGGGRLFHGSTQGVGFNGGMILELFTTNWVTFRFDVRDLVLVQEAVAETRLTNNIIASFGISLWLPTGL